MNRVQLHAIMLVMSMSTHVVQCFTIFNKSAHDIYANCSYGATTRSSTFIKKGESARIKCASLDTPITPRNRLHTLEIKANKQVQATIDLTGYTFDLLESDFLEFYVGPLSVTSEDGLAKSVVTVRYNFPEEESKAAQSTLREPEAEEESELKKHENSLVTA